MKIGIMSMQRVHNLGSFLQAYGLKLLVEELGHQVVFLDIPEGEAVKAAVMSGQDEEEPVWKRKVKKAGYAVRIKKYRRMHTSYYSREYPEYLKRYLNIGEEICQESCDTLIVGSDEVFNCLNPAFGFSKALFGGYEKAGRTISYAASCGWTRFSHLDDEIKRKLRMEIGKLEAISVRDENTKDFIAQLTGQKALRHLDPALVADFSVLTDKAGKRYTDRPYILIYGYYNRISEPETIRQMRRLARESGCILTALGAPQYWCRQYITADPADVPRIFEEAEFVLTDTFHGTVLSIRAHKRFAVIVRKSNENKLMDLLTFFGLENRAVNSADEIRNRICKEVDYERVDALLEREKERTREYLMKALEAGNGQQDEGREERN